MTIEQMRAALLSAYPGPSWKNKVKSMSDGQVLAIYRRLQQTNKQTLKG